MHYLVSKMQIDELTLRMKNIISFGKRKYGSYVDTAPIRECISSLFIIHRLYDFVSLSHGHRFITDFPHHVL